MAFNFPNSWGPFPGAQFPYTQTGALNMDWVLREVKRLACRMDNFIEINSIKIADPIAWDITRQYPPNMIVVDDATNTAYLSKRPVPAGAEITDTEYWLPIMQLPAYDTPEVFFTRSHNVGYNCSGLQTLVDTVPDNTLIVFDGDQSYSSDTVINVKHPVRFTSTCPSIDVNFMIDSNYVEFEGVFWDCHTALFPIRVNTGRYLRVLNCRFANPDTAISTTDNNSPSDGGFFHKRGCWIISNCTFEGIRIGIAAYFSKSDSDPTAKESRYEYQNDWTITNNIFNFAKDYSIYIDGLDGLILSNNVFFAGVRSGQRTLSHLYVDDLVAQCIATSNNFFVTGGWQIDVAEAPDCAISQNRIIWSGDADTPAGAIRVRGDSPYHNSIWSMTISGNICMGSSDNLIYCAKSNCRLNVSGNTFTYAEPPDFTGSINPELRAIVSNSWQTQLSGNQFGGLPSQGLMGSQYRGVADVVTDVIQFSATANTWQTGIRFMPTFAGVLIATIYPADALPTGLGSQVFTAVYCVALEHNSGKTDENNTGRFTRLGQSYKPGGYTFDIALAANNTLSIRPTGSAPAEPTEYRLCLYYVGYNPANMLTAYDTFPQ